MLPVRSARALSANNSRYGSWKRRGRSFLLTSNTWQGKRRMPTRHSRILTCQMGLLPAETLHLRDHRPHKPYFLRGTKKRGSVRSFTLRVDINSDAVCRRRARTRSRTLFQTCSANRCCVKCNSRQSRGSTILVCSIACRIAFHSTDSSITVNYLFDV